MKTKTKALLTAGVAILGDGSPQVVSPRLGGLLEWHLRQQTAVSLGVGLAWLLTVVNLDGSQPWNLCAPPVPLYNQWQAVAASADASILIAAGYTFEPLASGPGTTPIYVSTNSGATWTTNGAPTQAWQAVACSANGAVVIAMPQGTPYAGSDLIYTSPDMGATWRANGPSDDWSSVAASADGTRLIATTALWTIPPGGAIVVLGDGLIYISTNSGAAWFPSRAPTNEWISVAVSADGTSVVAASGNGTGGGADGFIYLSTDGGDTWRRSSATSNDWVSVASSADGTVLLAASTTANGAGDGLIYSSSDSGASWAPTAAQSDAWAAITLSSDGTLWMAAAQGSGVIYISRDFGTTWTPTDASASWAGLATSADGYKVLAGSSDGWLCTLPYSGPWRFASAPAHGGGLVASSADFTNLLLAAGNQIFTSSDAGLNWTPTGPSDPWDSLASSADGAKLFAATGACGGGDGLIYASTDSGATWNPTAAPSNQWLSIACSADGNSLIAATIADSLASNSVSRIYKSSDAGATWTPTSASTGGGTGGTNGDFAAVAMSADGTKAVATTSEWFTCFARGGRFNYLIYISTNSASSWTRTQAPANQWSCVASSADGSKLIAGAYGFWAYGDGRLYTSSDSGGTWRPAQVPENNWSSVALSADGAQMLAVATGDNDNPSAVYISRDSGTNWAPAGMPAWNWNAVASSADGSNVVVVGRGFICILQSPPPAPPLPPSPQLSLALSATNVSLSWLVPSTPFVLQQSSSLSPTSWVDLPANHTLNLTNLHYQVTLRPSQSASFYRLRRQ